MKLCLDIFGYQFTQLEWNSFKHYHFFHRIERERDKIKTYPTLQKTMNFAPFSNSQFKCCPGHPYSYPQYYFTPLVCQWQQPDFRPIHFGNETRYSTKTGCIPPACHIYTPKVAVVTYDANLIERLSCDLNIDRIYVIVTSLDQKREFIEKFKFDSRVRNKVVRTYSRCRDDEETLRDFANRYLCGESAILFPRRT